MRIQMAGPPGPIHNPDSSTQSHQLNTRRDNRNHGWIYGSKFILETHDGGATWAYVTPSDLIAGANAGNVRAAGGKSVFALACAKLFAEAGDRREELVGGTGSERGLSPLLSARADSPRRRSRWRTTPQQAHKKGEELPACLV